MKQFIRLSLLIGLSFIWATTVAAHPMGNFSINHYSGLTIGKESIHIRYILDFAEIPAFQEIQEIDRNGDGEKSPSEITAYLDHLIPQLTQNLVLKIANADVTLQVQNQELRFPPGAGGLPTMRLAIDYRANLSRNTDVKDRPLSLTFMDDNYPQRTGWKEMSASGFEGINLIDSTLPTEGSELRAYPDDPMQVPPQVVLTQFAFQASGTSINKEALKTGVPNIKTKTPRDNTLSQLMTGHTPSGLPLVLVFVIAFGLGSLHALSPGHGKTLVAAYLVGAQGTIRHALLLGLCVTFAHTVGVFLLGFVTLYLSDIIVPESLYPWLGRFSGLGIFIIGLSVLRKRLAGMKSDHSHNHTHRHNHAHETKVTGLRGILALGISGGIIPCPSALIVLLSAVAFHQVGFGLLLIVAFSAGLAATLVGIGLVVVTLGGIFQSSGRFIPLVRYLPPLSAACMATLGILIAMGGIGP